MQQELRARRLVFIDGLRGVASTIVVLHHLVGRTSADWLMHWGYLGVAIFFVLSGFVIAMSVGDSRISASFLGRFALRRAIRLDPPYWASIVLAVALAALASRLGLHREAPTMPQVLAHLVYLQEILGVPAISQIYWTLCYEVQFYLFLILLLWTGRWFLPLWAAMFGWSLLENAALVDVVPTSIFVQYWFAFALGASVHYVIAGRMPAWALGAAMIAALAFVPFRHADWLITSMITAGVIFLAHRRGAMSLWLSDPVSQFLGRISYSLYLFHPLVGWTAMSVALKFADQWTALLVGIIASVISAWIAYMVVERNSVRWARTIALEPERPAAPMGSAAERV